MVNSALADQLCSSCDANELFGSAVVSRAVLALTDHWILTGCWVGLFVVGIRLLPSQHPPPLPRIKITERYSPFKAPRTKPAWVVYRYRFASHACYCGHLRGVFGFGPRTRAQSAEDYKRTRAGGWRLCSSYLTPPGLNRA